MLKHGINGIELIFLYFCRNEGWDNMKIRELW